MINAPVKFVNNPSRTILSILFLLLICAAFAQDFEFADMLYSQRDFQSAVLEYKRGLISPETDREDSLYAIKRIMASLYLDTQWENLHHSSRQYYHLLTQEDYFSRYNALALIKEGYYMPATILLESARHPQAMMLRGMTLEYLGQTEQARRNYEEASQSLQGGEDMLNALLHVNKDLRQLRHKNPLLAGALGIIPGAGYAYTGKYETAIAALVINAALFAASVELYQNEMKWSAGIAFSVFSGFYLGSIYGSASAAVRDRSDAMRRYMDTFINLHVDYFLDAPSLQSP